MRPMGHFLDVALILAGGTGSLAFAWFAVTSLKEKEHRAARIAAALALATAVVCAGAAAMGGLARGAVAVAIGAGLLSAVIVWLWPVGRSVAPRQVRATIRRSSCESGAKTRLGVAPACCIASR